MKIDRKNKNFKQLLLEKQAVETAELLSKDRYWDSVAERLLQTGLYDVRGKRKIQSSYVLDLKETLNNKKNKIEILNRLKEDFQNKKIGFLHCLKKLSLLGNGRSVNDVKVLLTKIALRKVYGETVKGLEDSEIKERMDKLGKVYFTVKELGDVLRYVRSGYGSNDVVVQFLEVWFGDLAKEVVEEYLGQVL